MHKLFAKRAPCSKALLRYSCLSALLLTTGAANAALECELGEIRAWHSGFMVRDIHISNNTSGSLSSPQVRLSFDNTVGVDEVWGGSATPDVNGVILTGSGYNATIDPGSSARFGFKGIGRPEGIT